MSANYTRQNMTPGATADCYLPGCLGVTGGLCVGALPEGAPVNQTLWWCCTPYAETCRGGQSACPGTSCTSGTASWCCNSALETCPGADGLEGSCVPLDYPNPVLNGPAWGPNAVISSSAVANTTIAATISSTGTVDVVTETAVPAATESGTVSGSGGGSGSGSGSGGLSVGGAAGVGVVAGVLGTLAVMAVVWVLRKKGRTGENKRYIGELDGDTKPVEVEGAVLHEMEGGSRETPRQ